MARIKAFMLGIREFRSDVTTSYRTPQLLMAYDVGRELAHRLTFRLYEH